MSYSTPLQRSYSFDHDFGAGSNTVKIKNPGNRLGKVKDVQLTATEAFTADTTAGSIKVGNGSDDDHFATLGCATTADGAAISAADGDGTLVDDLIQTTEDVTLTFTAPTGGTPAGIGTVTVAIDWF
jgi:hypothetical protein